jgi:hypothetical protein
MSKKKAFPKNPWQTLHNSYGDEKKVEVRKNIINAAEWGQDTFYRKMRNPQKLKTYEKLIVAGVYGVEVETLFPLVKTPAQPQTA